MQKQFTNKIVAVTGGTKGIGKSCCYIFAEKGAKVVFSSRNAVEGKQMEKDLSLISNDCLFIKCDVLNEEDILNFIRKTVNKYSKIDVLVNNAGTHISKLMDEYSLKDFDCLINTNLRNYFLHCKFAIPYLIESGGNIVNISSATGLLGQYKGSLYSATKAGIIAFTKSIALDYAKYNVRANCVLPASVDTPLTESWCQQQKNPEEVKKVIGNIHPLGRIMIPPEEVASVVCFLASNDACSITGAAIEVDRGASLDYSPAAIEF